MEITKEVKPFIRRGWPNTFGNIVYIYINKYIFFEIKKIKIKIIFGHDFFLTPQK